MPASPEHVSTPVPEAVVSMKVDIGAQSGARLTKEAQQYVNFAQGWQPRLLVLQDDTVRYWKLRKGGDLKILGLKAAQMEEHGKRSSSGEAVPEPATTLSLKVANVRPSKRDPRKFKLDTGTSEVLMFKAADTEERWRWVKALKSAQEAWAELHEHMSKAISLASPGLAVPQEDAQLLAEVQAGLTARGASAEVQQFVAQALERQRAVFMERLQGLENQRQTLVHIASSLVEQKDELEQQLALGPTQLAASSEEFDAAGGLLAASTATDIENGALDSDGSDVDGALFADAPTETAWLSRTSSSGSVGSGSPGNADSQRSLAGKPPSAKGVDAADSVQLRRMDTADVTRQRLVPAWLKDEGAPPPRRTRLPPPAQQEKPVSLWAIIKEMIGKDLTRVCLPVYFNEPLSALQKIAEDLEYSELLDKAALCGKGSVERLLWLSAFAISGYSGTVNRTSKPFNPLLGETYELLCQEKAVRLLCEKVVHHPTIIAAVAEGAGWTMQGDAEVKSKFWGRSIELIPEGVLQVSFHDGESYSWNKVTTYINNLILGKIYVDHGGLMKISSAQSGLVARIRFKEAGMLYDKNPRQVKGHIERGHACVPGVTIRGHWDREVVVDMPDGSTQRLWTKSPPAADPTRYNLTSWAIKLNELTPGLKERLAPTDCRLRPDQAFLEQGMHDEANAEKQRLEEKQRAARRAAERGDPIRPRWFSVVEGAKPGHDLMFQYKGGYWESRAAGQYEGCRDIFGKTVPPSSP